MRGISSRTRRRCITLGFGALSLLGGCVPPQAPPTPTSIPTRVATAASVPRPEPRVLTARWQFVNAPSACTATASASGASFAAYVDATQVRFWHSGGDAPRSQRVAPTNTRVFSGPDGEWRLPGERGANGAISAQLPLDEPAVVRVLALLGGGVVTAERGGAGPLQLRLPPGGAQGRAWYECVRRLLLT
ncbi:MAG: hypothetical protein V4653_04150 [Pseudomonadota bacterium]